MDDSIVSVHDGKPPAQSKALFRGCLVIGLVSVVFAGAISLGLGHLMGPEQLASFQVGQRTINVYAEGDFHYEPPGYICFELLQWGQTRIPQRRFMGIGPTRKPAQQFRLITTANEETVALVLNDEVQMIHEFSSGYTWPGPYTNVTEAQWQFAEISLQRLRDTNPEILCPRQESYRQDLDRRKQIAR